MKKLALLLAFTPLVTQANTMNPYVRDHEAYASWHPLLTQVGGTIAAVALGMWHLKTSAQVRIRVNEVRQEKICVEAAERRMREEQERNRRNIEERQRQFAERQRQDAARNAQLANQQPQAAAANHNPAAEECPVCLENKPLMVVCRDNGHKSCRECIFGQFKRSRVRDVYVYDAELGRGTYYQNKFNCCICRGAVDPHVAQDCELRAWMEF